MSESERKKRADRKKSTIPDKDEELRDARERRAILEQKRRVDAEAKVAAAKRKNAATGGIATEAKGAMGRKEDVYNNHLISAYLTSFVISHLLYVVNSTLMHHHRHHRAPHQQLQQRQHQQPQLHQ
jgi:hypothetical protein